MKTGPERNQFRYGKASSSAPNPNAHQAPAVFERLQHVVYMISPVKRLSSKLKRRL
jgi:hypothetical protein